MAATILAAVVLAGFWLACATSDGWRRTISILMPEQSAAKARAAHSIRPSRRSAGGAYLNVHDMTCTGRISQFDHSGELNGFGKFIDYAQPPDKDATRESSQAQHHRGLQRRQGVDLDRGGVSEAPQPT